MEKKRCYGCMRIKTSSPFCEHCGHDERNQNAPHQLPAGTVLREQYLVGKVLGQGGFGITYLGWDLYLDIPVAIKEYYPTGVVMREATQTFSVVNCLDDDGGRFHNNRDRFMREAKMLARFSYVPEIVQIKNFFLANNTAYIVMEYVQGITLKEYIRRKGGRLSVQETFAILQPIMVGLSKIHKAGLIHRDISPDNIMMLPGGGAKLLDFGAVRDVGAAQVNQELSQPTEAILKQGYAPIEQYQQKGALGPWSDVYALCATIYYCLTGTVPPDSPARMLEEEKVTFDPRIGLDKRQIRALTRGMALRAADRSRNMEELYQELFGRPIPAEDDGAGQTPVKPPEPPVDPPKPPVDPPGPSGRKWWIPLVAVLLIACGIGAWFLLRPKEGRLADRIPTTETTGAHLPKPEDKSPTETTEPQLTAPTEPQRPVVKDPAENTLMEHILEDSDVGEKEPAFRTSVAREQVQSITVLYTTADAPVSAVDVSMKGNGKVLAWTEKNGELYDLYLAAEGGIYAPVNSRHLFACFTNAKTIEFNDAFYTDNVEIGWSMFYRDTSLENVDVSGFNTENMTNMRYMFANCENVKELKVENFVTGKVTDMEAMFQSCKAVSRLEVSGFDTSNVTSMAYMFTQCGSLEELKVHNFNTGKVTDMKYMFNGCGSLTELKVSGFQTGEVKSMEGMFQDCTKVEQLQVGDFQTGNVESMRRMFNGCGAVTTLNVSGFDTGKVEDMYYMFNGCGAVTTLNVSGFNTANVKNMRCMFQNCSKVSRLEVGNFNTEKVEDMSYMFTNCHAITELNVENWKTGQVKEMIATFRECTGLSRLDVSGFETGNVTSMARMFEGCSGLTELNVNGLETNSVTDMEYMFNGCSSLTELNVSGFVTDSVVDMHYMFNGCKNLRSLNLRNFNTAAVTNMSYMLYGCDSLTDLKLGTFETSAVTNHDSFMEPGKKVNSRDWTELFS